MSTKLKQAERAKHTHTAGLWKVGEDRVLKAFVIYAQGIEIEVWGEDCRARSAAHLIAAAPMLIDFLKADGHFGELEAWAEQYGVTANTGTSFREFRQQCLDAAIRKAEGRQ